MGIDFKVFFAHDAFFQVVVNINKSQYKQLTISN